jgi:hypothetical protein
VTLMRAWGVLPNGEKRLRLDAFVEIATARWSMRMGPPP